jgi:hypothetical protein
VVKPGLGMGPGVCRALGTETMWMYVLLVVVLTICALEKRGEERREIMSRGREKKGENNINCIGADYELTHPPSQISHVIIHHNIHHIALT